jgi:Tfp pilus assembly protein FimT
VVAPRAGHRRRRALTLLEILLVLGLLVILASLALPAMERPLATHRLRQAGDSLRTEWARARNQAIASGQALAFHCNLGERTGSLERMEESDGSSPSLSSVDDGSLAADDGSTRLSQADFSLPENVTFAQAEAEEESDLSTTEAAPQAVGSSAASSSPSIVFYPDGSTSTARVILKNERDQLVEVSLRGLTGIATVGEVYSAEGAVP